MNPCQHPKDCVYASEFESYSSISLRIIDAVYLAISIPVLNWFCNLILATYSGLIEFQFVLLISLIEEASSIILLNLDINFPVFVVK